MIIPLKPRTDNIAYDSSNNSIFISIAYLPHSKHPQCFCIRYIIIVFLQNTTEYIIRTNSIEKRH